MDDRPLSFAFDSGTLFVSGTVDELSAVQLREAISKHSEDLTTDLTIDLCDVDLLPSVGVGVLAVAMREAETRGAAVDLVAAPGTVVQRVLNICGMPFRER